MIKENRDMEKGNKVLTIYTYGAPVLRKVARSLPDIKEETVRLAKDMIYTMNAAEGVGLAANQIGVLERIIVVKQGEEKSPLVIINPEIIKREGEEILEEGCLSIPGIREKIKRSHYVRVEGVDIKGRRIMVEGEGILARILEHEIDHLNGILFVDRLSMVKKGLIRPKLKALVQKNLD